MDTSYNKVSLYQKNAVAQATPVAETTIATLMKTYKDEGLPFVIADYGSSLGLHSVITLTPVVKKILETIPTKDIPSNDFQQLFQTSTSAQFGSSNVFIAAIGKSFFERVLPSEYVDFAWTSIAIHWLHTKIPLPNGTLPMFSEEETHKKYLEIAHQDCTTFLSHRAKELKKGAKLVILNAGANEKGRIPLTDFHQGFAHAKLLSKGRISQERNDANIKGFTHAKLKLLSEGLISQEENDNMLLPMYHRSMKQLLQAIDNNIFKLDYSQELCFLCPYLTQFNIDGDRLKMVNGIVNNVRSFSYASFASALVNRDVESTMNLFYSYFSSWLFENSQKESYEGYQFAGQILVLQKL